MPSSAYTNAAARTDLEILTALRSVTGKTAAVKRLNAAIGTAIAEAEKLLIDERDLPLRGRRSGLMPPAGSIARAGGDGERPAPRSPLLGTMLRQDALPFNERFRLTVSETRQGVIALPIVIRPLCALHQRQIALRGFRQPDHSVEVKSFFRSAV